MSERGGASETKKKRGPGTKVGTDELSDQGRGRNAEGRFLIPQVPNKSVLSRTPRMMWAKLLLLCCARVIQNKYDKKLELKRIDS